MFKYPQLITIQTLLYIEYCQTKMNPVVSWILPVLIRRCSKLTQLNCRARLCLARSYLVRHFVSSGPPPFRCVKSPPRNRYILRRTHSLPVRILTSSQIPTCTSLGTGRQFGLLALRIEYDFTRMTTSSTRI